MPAARMIVDIHERIVQDGADWTEPRILGFDVSDVFLSVIGEDPNGEVLASYLAEPWEFPQIGHRLEEHPDIGFPGEISPDFDVLAFLDDGLSRDSSDEEIAAAWRRWRTSMLSGDDGTAWERSVWKGRAEELAGRLDRLPADVPADVLLPFARECVRIPAMLAAIAEALRSWNGDPIDGLRAVQGLHKALSVRGGTDDEKSQK